MKTYASAISPKKTAQSSAIPGRESDQKENRAGGYVFTVSPWTQFNRFLILGSEGNTYYASEKEMTVENAKNVIKCIKEDGVRAVNEIVSVSDEGRAIKNDAAIFALALACAFGDEATKQLAYRSITKVCRIGTHLFQFAQSIQDLRNWSRGLRSGVAAFYTNRKPEQLGLQLVKYRQRNGWTHRDVIRLAHPKVTDPASNELIKWVLEKEDVRIPEGSIVEAFQRVQKLGKEDIKATVKLIRDFELPREALPTEVLNEVEVWEALLQKMPATAMIRNLGKMTSVGLLKSNLTAPTKLIKEKLSDGEWLKKNRVHPMSILIAMKTYEQGHGEKGSLKWEPINGIVDALDKAFYLAFKAVEPTNKNYMLALDVSGSMDSNIGHLPLTCREAAAAMALVTANVEKNCEIIGFTSAGSGFTGTKARRSTWGSYGDETGVSKLSISPRQRLDDVVEYISDMPFGGTDCALPMLYAIKNELMVDTFVIYTDNESWAGSVHPSQALQEYRKRFNKNAKMVACAFTATDYSVADPKDAGMMDVAGFDTTVPQVIAQFSNGTL